MEETPYAVEHRKGQHLTSDERHEIEVRLKDGWSVYRIARHLGRAYNTIRNEVNRGLVSLYGGKVQRYRADVGEATYKKHRQNCRRRIRILEVSKFIQFVVQHFKGHDKWSLDACVGYALANHLFPRNQMVCTKTLYTYVSIGLLSIKNIDLPEKVRRRTKPKKVRQHKRILGASIEERPEVVDAREEFGHWELDSVLGRRTGKSPCVITLTERTTRMCLWIKARDHTAEAVNDTLKGLFPQFGDRWHEVFKTITTDNGSEFALLRDLGSSCRFYFTHPYASSEKGTNERHNRMLRRFIPKGKSIADYAADDIVRFANCINNLPRKILNYDTPEQRFAAQLVAIYAA